jgi:hypothetical protein
MGSWNGYGLLLICDSKKSIISTVDEAVKFIQGKLDN